MASIATAFNQTFLFLVCSYTLPAGMIMFYWYVYSYLRSLRGGGEENPGAVVVKLGEAGKAIEDLLRGKCPKCPDAAAPDDDDKDAWLDSIGDKPPPIVPSHFAQVHGIEPFEQHDLKEW